MRALILPCETRSREFEAKLLLACRAAARGIDAWVGSKKVLDLQLARMPAAVYVGKSVTERTAHNFLLARKAGHRLATWDEEGLVWASREVYWRTKVGSKTLALPELLLAWGEENAEAWRGFPGYTGNPIAVTGNPRADLLRRQFRPYFADQARAIGKDLGPFMLVNTNFSRVNHIQPRQNRHLKWLRENRPDDPRGGFAAHKFELFKAFRKMLPELAAALPETRIVIRPHPSEDSGTWEDLAAGHDNLLVRREGNVIPWLLASSGLIHNGCTTAVESWLVERPALAWMPVRNPSFDHPLPNNISLQQDSHSGLVEAVKACMSDREQVFIRQASGSRRQWLEKNIQSGSSLACDRVLDALMPLLEDTGPPIGARPGLARLALAARRGFRWLEHRLPGQGNSRDYLAHMFPSITGDEVRHMAAVMGDCLVDSSPVRVDTPFPAVFRLSSAV